MRSRLVWGAALLLALAPAADAAAAGHDRCRPQVIDLGTLPGHTFSIAFAMGPDRVLAGWSRKGDEPFRPVRWAHGRAEELPAPPGQAAALDINRVGVIVGRSSDGMREQPLVWRGGRLSVLPGLPDGLGAQARRISDSGLITGSAFDAAGREHVVLWVAGRLVNLGVPKGYDGAYGIDVTDDGEVVANAYTASGEVGFRFQHHRWQRLAGLGGADALAQVAGAHGETGGFTWPGNPNEATIWDRRGRARSLGFFARGDSSAILATDGVGGYAGAGNLEPGGPPHALLSRGRGRLLTLPAISGPDGVSSLRYLDRDGNAAGLSDPGDGGGHATLWTCVWHQAFRPAK